MTFKKIAKKVKQTKEELEVKRQRVLIKDVVYPILLKDSLNIEDAKMVLGATSIAIKQAYSNLMVKMEVNELGLKTMISKGSENDRFRNILEAFENENVSNAIKLIDGLVETINSFQREESTKRPLSDLKVELL